tara:strand:- start:1094 stop:1714 length:621 start_codon:yes stop_codon:yes gene_type:complete
VSTLNQRINFYQDSFRKPVIVLPLKQLLLGIGLVLGLLLVVTALEWSRTLAERETLATMESSRQRLEVSIDKLQQQVDSIVLDERLQQEEQRLQDGLQSKRQFLYQLQQQGDTHMVHFSGYLQALANRDNASIWLTRIVMQSPGPELSLHGITDKPKTIPAYVADLKQEDQFQGFGFKVFNLERMQDDQRFLTFSVSTQHDERPAN